MAHFKLELLTSVVNQIDSSDQGSHDVYFLKDTITDFYSQSLTSTHLGHSFSYDEKFTIHRHAQKELTFSMYQKVWQNDDWVLNPFVSSIHVGSTILLTTKDGREHFMTVKNIALKFSAINISYQYTCQDSFSYQLIRQNDGYMLNNDAEEADFIGAHDIDYWTQTYIQPECYIAYQYIPLKQGIYQDTDGHSHLYQNEDVLNKVHETIKVPYTDPSFYETIVFSCSGSNGNAALISLAEQLGLMINVYEHLVWRKGHWVAVKYFWFEPDKHNEFNGIYYSPNNNVQSFGLSLAGDSITTVLNVQTTEVGDEIVGLFPSVPGFFVNYFASPDWEQSKYYPGMFLDLLQGEYWRCDGSLTDTLELGLWTTDIEFNNQKYIGYALLSKTQSLTIPRWYSKMRFYWEDNITSFDEVNSYGSVLYLYVEHIEQDITSQYLFTADEEIPLDLLGKECKIWVVYKQPEIYQTPVESHIYIYWYRDVSDEEYAFADIADKCPWLENKLIDFTYFRDQNMLSLNEYKLLSNFINDNMRIVNGKLMAHSQAYYAALHKQTATTATLTNQLDMLGATMQAEMITPYATLGKVGNTGMIINTYNNLFRSFDSNKPIQLLNHSELLSETLQKYFNAEQRFLKNIKNFKDYFEMTNAFASRPNVCIVEDQLTITPSNTDNTIAFEPIAFTSVFETPTSGPDNRIYKDQVRLNDEPLVTLYRNTGDVYEPVTIAAPSTIKQNLIYVPRTVAGSLSAVKKSDEYNVNLNYFIPKDTYTDLLFDYDNSDLADMVKQTYIDREVISEGKTYIRLLESEIIRLYLNAHPNEYYVRDTERLIPFDWIRYDKSGWETDATNGALRGINPAAIPHHERGNSHYWWGRKYLDTPVSDSFAKDNNPDDKWDAWAAYRFSFGISNIYYYGAKHKLTTSFNDNQTTYTIDRINEKGWTLAEYKKQEADFKKDHPNDNFTAKSPADYYVFQPMSFYSALPSGYHQIAEYTSTDYQEWRANSTKDFNYFSFVPNAAMLGWGIGLACAGGGSLLGLIGSLPFGWIGTAIGGIIGIGLMAGAFMEENSQWVNQYQANRYFTPDSEWKHPLFKTTTDEFTAPIKFDYENKMITSLKLYDSYRAIYAKTATSMSENKTYTEAMNKNAGQWDYINYYNLLVATYSFEIDGNLAYTKTDFTANEKIITDAYDENDQPNRDYKFWVKNRYYRLIGHDDYLARGETYKLLILNGTKRTPIETEKETDGVKETIIDIEESEESIFTDIIQWNPGFTDSKNTEYFPTRFSAIQFGFLEAGGLVNVSLDTDSDLWKEKDDENKTAVQLSVKLASEVFNDWIVKDAKLYTSYLPDWGEEYCPYLWSYSIDGKDIYFLLVHEENYECGRIDSYTHYKNWDDYRVDYRTVNVAHLYNYQTHARAKILQQQDLFSSLSDIDIRYQVVSDTNFRLATMSDWNQTAKPSFYYGLNNNYYKTYSLDDWCKQKEVLYMQNGRELVVTNFEQDTKKFDVTFFLRSQYKDENNGYTSSYIRYPSIYTLDFTNSDTIDVTIWYNDVEYTSQVTLTNGTNPETLRAMSNGEFWYRYHNKTEWPLILEQCAIIEAELTMWWNAALTASKYCEYFIPDSWLPTVDNSQNYFAKDIWQLSYKNLGSTDTNITPELTKVGLSTTYIPKVLLHAERDEQGVWQTYLPTYKLVYNPSVQPLGKSAATVLANNPAYESCKQTLLQENGWTNWLAEENGKRTYYYVDPASNSGTKWKNLISQLAHNATTYEWYTGLYAMQFYLLFNYYTSSSLSTYEHLLKQKAGLWQYLYSLYPNVLLESTYQNDKISSSAQLYKEAQLAFKDKMHPEKQYNITIMDMNNVIGDRSLFRIGEPIAINAQEYYSEPDDIFQALSQFLFITDISYTLRNDADIQLTVNSIKYQEKLLQQLVKLIR